MVLNGLINLFWDEKIFNPIFLFSLYNFMIHKYYIHSQWGTIRILFNRIWNFFQDSIIIYDPPGIIGSVDPTCPITTVG